MRYCTGCGKHRVQDYPKWKTKCPMCFRDFKNTFGQGDSFLINVGGSLTVVHETLKLPLAGYNVYCVDCGVKLEKDRMMFALRRTTPELFAKGQLNEACRCYTCSRK